MACSLDKERFEMLQVDCEFKRMAFTDLKELKGCREGFEGVPTCTWRPAAIPVTIGHDKSCKIFQCPKMQKTGGAR